MTGVCVVQTNDGGIRFFERHDPIPVQSGQKLQMNLRFGGTAVAVWFCRRCNVLYVEAHERDFTGHDREASQHPGSTPEPQS